MIDIVDPHSIIAGIGEVTIGGILYYVYKCIEKKVESIEHRFEKYKEKHAIEHKDIYCAIEKLQDKMDRKLDDISDKQTKIFESLGDVKSSVSGIDSVFKYIKNNSKS